jgi:hypothetical protein
MENPVPTDVVEASELDGLETVPDINKNKLAVIQPSTTRNMPVRKIRCLSVPSKELTDTKRYGYTDI